VAGAATGGAAGAPAREGDQAGRPPLTLGTAGHIDHGKTALIRALTGRDTDRLPEERARGISIALGYAPLQLPSGRHLSLVDVPGHERFVRTMVAGATGVDMFLLCVAADDGVMPQTREHMAVLRQLGVGDGVVAITKSDTGEPELAAEEAAELVPGVPVVHVSALRRTGLDELVAALDSVASGLAGRAGDEGPTRLHVDRSFTLRGIGTVVTGTLWAGSLAAGDSVRLLPRGLEARVRSVQVHDQAVERAVAGQRVALNLAGVGWREVGRGDVVVRGDSGLRPGYLLDVAAAVEPGARPLRRGERVQVHHGTREAPARVVPLSADELAPGAGGYAQVRLEGPLVAAPGDRLILRQVAPPDTVGGAVVIDASPRKHGPSADVVERLRRIERGEGVEPVDPAPAPAAETSGPEDEPEPLDERALALAAMLRADGATPRADGDLAEAAGVPAGEAARLFTRLERAGEAVRVGRALHFHPAPLAVLEAEVVRICERDGQATIAGLRDELGTSRKYAQALLEHLDRTKVTLRRGDAHVLRRRRSP
jgi:selenocysteine-specific elongation factor